MVLTRTVNTVAAGGQITASSHKQLVLAMDELLEARYNERSWLIFNTSPTLELGDTFTFGTPSNLGFTGAPYVFADETVSRPTGGQVVSWDSTAKVVWVTGMVLSETLNRKHVGWRPPATPAPDTEWWIGTSRPERFDRLALADVLVEAYTDHDAGVTSVFTWRENWDRHGCMRIHNGNRFALTVEFEDGQPSKVIPPYGIICGRRLGPFDEWLWESTYLPVTHKDDAATWQKHANGQSAANMETLISLVSGGGLGVWCRMPYGHENDSTSRESKSFTGATPVGSDLLYDWLIHKGDLLSVVLDKRDGTITKQTLTWRGLTSVPDATWAGFVDVTVSGASLTLESAVTAPAGASAGDWEHDLIPVATNLTAGQIVALHAGPVVLSPPPLGLIDKWSRVSGFSEGYESSQDFRLASGTLLDYPVIGHQAVTGGSSADWETLLSDFYADPDESVLPFDVDAFFKNSHAIGRKGLLTLDMSSRSMSDISFDILDGFEIQTDTELTWKQSWRYTINGGDRRRFSARKSRRYQDAGVVAGGSAQFNQHPQDKYPLGTPDALALDIGVLPLPLSTSPIKIEGQSWTQTPTSWGRNVWIPADVLHAAVTQIDGVNWWLDNRDRILAGTLDPEEAVLTWRIPRHVEEFNDLALAINSVQEVIPATIEHLYQDPLPFALASCRQFPFDYSGENPFAVPVGWSLGRYDASTDLDDWATTWGVTTQTTLPDLSTLKGITRMVWARDFEARTIPDPLPLGSVLYRMRKVSPGVVRPSNTPHTVNGESFYPHNLWHEDTMRLLFGGAGSDTDYVWITEDDLHAVFDDLGVPIPPSMTGERYTPVMEVDHGTELSVIQGTHYGTAADVTQDGPDACQAYRLPDPDGTWLQVWDDTGSRPFRLIDAANTSKRRYIETQQNDVGDDEWLVHEWDETANGLLYNLNSPQALAHNTVPTTDFPIWWTGSEIYGPHPIMLLVSPEPWVEHSYPTLTDPADIADPTETLTDQIPASGGMHVYEIDAADLPVTPASIRTLTGLTWDSFHCQIRVRSGVRRA